MREIIKSVKRYKDTETGQEEKVYLDIGTLTTKKDKKYMELNMFPGLTFYVFPEK